MDVCIGRVVCSPLVRVSVDGPVRIDGAVYAAYVGCSFATFVDFTLLLLRCFRNILLRLDEGGTRVVSVLERCGLEYGLNVVAIVYSVGRRLVDCLICKVLTGFRCILFGRNTMSIRLIPMNGGLPSFVGEIVWSVVEAVKAEDNDNLLTIEVKVGQPI